MSQEFVNTSLNSVRVCVCVFVCVLVNSLGTSILVFYKIYDYTVICKSLRPDRIVLIKLTKLRFCGLHTKLYTVGPDH